MIRYVVQRFVFMLITLLLVSVIIFIIIELPPGDYAERYAYRKLATAGQDVTEQDMINLRIRFGLDRPAPEVVRARRSPTHPAYCGLRLDLGLVGVLWDLPRLPGPPDGEAPPAGDSQVLLDLSTAGDLGPAAPALPPGRAGRRDRDGRRLPYRRRAVAA